MLPSCKQVTEQLSDNLDEPISGMKWVKLKVHLLMCAYCRLYGKQIEITSRILKKYQQKLPSESFEKQMLDKYKNHHCSKNNHPE